MYKLNVASSSNCNCSQLHQTISHIGQPEDMFNELPETISWINNLNNKLWMSTEINRNNLVRSTKSTIFK
ncbi:Hypothetical protein CINCED_3A000084 [Cinara cedri]|uniref:Uncharacterized protein n=1 Tax=Cinara cedri TaxID=506608 RepID=A0A5E4NQ57_9HEMI|nr:Hypothetical protein CINCED_3A000084 [Cinara cedri]